MNPRWRRARRMRSGEPGAPGATASTAARSSSARKHALLSRAFARTNACTARPLRARNPASASGRSPAPAWCGSRTAAHRCDVGGASERNLLVGVDGRDRRGRAAGAPPGRLDFAVTPGVHAAQHVGVDVHLAKLRAAADAVKAHLRAEAAQDLRELDPHGRLRAVLRRLDAMALSPGETSRGRAGRGWVDLV